MQETLKANLTTVEAQYNKMVNTSVGKLISKLAIPTVISMLITSVYNLADTFFVSQISKQSSAAVGIVFPIMSIIQAFGFTLGMGSGSLISIKLGQKKNQEASMISSTAFFAAILTGLLITIFGNLFSSSIMIGAGATEEILEQSNLYGKFIFWGAPFMCASFVLNNDLRAEGKAFFSMIALTSGGLLNIILDPIFIFDKIDLKLFTLHGINLGITGAALATFISQIVSFSILFSFYLRKKSVCVISIKNISKKIMDLGTILTTGLPSFARQGLGSFSAILLNNAAKTYGDVDAIAAMTIVTKICMFVASIMIGIGQGFSPVSGYNYGAKRYDRVKQAYKFLVLSGMCIMSLFAIPGFIFAKQIISVFRDDPGVISVGIVALRWQIAFLPLHAVIVGTNMLMQSTKHVKQAAYLSMNRQGIYFIPAILILPPLLGITGVEISQFVADVLSTITAIPFLIWFLKKLDIMEREEKQGSNS